MDRLLPEAPEEAAPLPAPPPPPEQTEPSGPDAADHYDDPVAFCASFLRVRAGRDLIPFRPWEAQAKLARLVSKSRRVACRSGHKLGKSVLAAALAIWWACTRPSAVAIITGPTGRQVKRAIWKEVRAFWRNSPELQKIMPAPGLQPETGVRWGDGRELFGFSAENADAVSGPGGPEVFVVIDEASGVALDVWEALQGVRAGGGKVFAISNPTQTSGWFYDAFTTKRTGWELERISVLDSPNVIAGAPVIYGLAQQDFVDEVRDDHGVTSPQYAIRVLGEFPANVPNAVIGAGLVEAARERWDEDEEIDGETCDIGVDVARYGDDDSAVTARIGTKLFTPQWFQEKKGVRAVVNGYGAEQVTGLVQQCIAVLPVDKRRLRIKIDVTGEWGAPVARFLREALERGELPAETEIYDLVYSASSSDDAKYPVLRDEFWFGSRPFFKLGSLYPDGKLEAELIAPTYAPDVKGRNKVEKKKDIKKRLGRSPDRADAALLAIYEPPPMDDLSLGYSGGYDRRF